MPNHEHLSDLPWQQPQGDFRKVLACCATGILRAAEQWGHVKHCERIHDGERDYLRALDGSVTVHVPPDLLDSGIAREYPNGACLFRSNGEGATEHWHAWDYGPLNQGERVAIWSRCDSHGHNEVGVWVWKTKGGSQP